MEVAGLDGRLHVQADEGEVVGGDLEADGAGFAGRERDPFKGFELADGPVTLATRSRT